MPHSICETYPGLCEKSRRRSDRPQRLLRPANTNMPNGDRALLHAPPTVATPVRSDGTSRFENISAVLMMGLLLLTAYFEVAAVGGILVRGLGTWFGSAPSLPF